MSNYVLVNNVSSSPNPNVGYCNSWIEVANNAGRPFYSQASYITNLDDINISLQAGNVEIGSVHITDADTGLAASVANVGIGLGAIRVLSQDLEPIHDTISIGDTNGKYAFITNSALNIFNTNPVTAVQITNPVTAVQILNSLTNLSAFITNPSLEISNDIGNPIPVTGTVYTFQEPTQLDAFGRLRISSPVTLFDSSHRYRDNNLWSTLSANGGSVSFNQSQGLMDLNVTNTAGASSIRETTKVFSYQPGKSLLVMNTFVMASSATNLRQRVGYFGDQNGIYFQLDDGDISIVKRSLVTGSVTESVVLRSNWNGDKLDGTGSSGIVLDITKAQILWMDFEWLGVGTVRVGFIINGQFIVCHSFHHANIIDSTYITTASLPLRYEITNKAATTSGSKTLKQICSTVISEGGYELRGLQQAASIPITAPRTFAVAGTFYPIISIRLKTTPDRLDAIIILTALSILGGGNGIDYNWQVRASGTTTGGSWVDAGVDSAVNYNITGTSYAGGRILASGFLNASNQGSPNLDILKEALFKFQLERNNLTKTPFELTLVAAARATNGSEIFASMDWEEVSR
jgi:hypothetical protein